MFDTIKVSLPTSPPSPDSLSAQGFSVSFGRSARGRWMKGKLSRSDEAVRLEWFAHESGSATLTFETSVANFWRNSTGEEISDETSLHNALSKLESHISSLAGTPLNISEARVRRIDFFADFHLENEQAVMAFVDAALNSAGRRRMQAIRWGSSTAYLRLPSRSKEIIIYSKYRDSLDNRKRRKTNDDPAQWLNVLRVEARFMSTRACAYFSKQQLHLPDNRVCHLLKESIWKILMERTLSELNFNRSIPAGDQLMQILVKLFGATATDLFGFIHYRQEWGENFWQLMNMSPSTYRRKRLMLERAGLWTSSKTSEALPPLRLVKSAKAGKAAA